MLMGEVTIEKVYEELKALRSAVDEMRDDIADRFLTHEEEALLEKALDEHRKGKTISLEKLREELG